MPKLISKIKIIIVLSFMALAGLATLVYQKLFGGKAQFLPQDKFITGQNQPPSSTEEEKQQIASVIYAKTPEKGVREVIANTGSLDFIKPGQKVLVKPNVNSNDPAPGTTHPKAVAEVVRLAKSKGAYVIVGDRSNPNWKTIPAMKTIGIYQAVESAGANQIIGFENEQWIRVKPEKAQHWPKGFRIPKRLKEIDHIISVPVLHTHSIASHSLAIKNLVGLIHPADRMIFHASKNIEEMIAEIGLAVKPSLTVIDGTKSFIEGGPSHGTLAEPKVYLASKDILAADVIGIKILQKEGAKLFHQNPWQSPQVKRTLELELSNYNKEQIEKFILN